VKLIVTQDPNYDFANCASHWFELQPKVLVAVTGTNGKTSVANFTRQIWELLGHKAANLGTNGVEGATSFPLNLTTPDPVKLHRILSDLVQIGVTHSSMEASSHGLSQKRLDGTDLLAAAFTNLSHDHLDYHETLENYFCSKKSLFSRILSPQGTSVVNIDSQWGKKIKLISENRGIRNLTIGTESSSDLRILDQKFYSDGQDLRFSFQKQIVQLKLNLIGGFQASNVLLAAGLAIATGSMPAEIFDVLPLIKTVKGRMQLVVTLSNGASVYVDFAHTPDAIKTAINSIRPHILGRVSIVFGAGGNRDKEKRQMMGAVAHKWADSVYLTDDNPRDEDPAKIRSMIKLGAPNAVEIPDRAEAILIAISHLQAGDVLLISGKGHETGQVIGDTVFPFDDIEQASIAATALDRNI
jgi:UDP-N-acetylmuramoyl-L-alanyl-D-glutamate--2,6-diaminopimelate ligase